MKGGRTDLRWTGAMSTPRQLAKGKLVATVCSNFEKKHQVLTSKRRGAKSLGARRDGAHLQPLAPSAADIADLSTQRAVSFLSRWIEGGRSEKNGPWASLA